MRNAKNMGSRRNNVSVKRTPNANANANAKKDPHHAIKLQKK
jgi:hypothetical protein